MKVFLQSIVKLYKYLLFFYPLSYRREFGEEMLLAFSAMVVDASNQGKFSLIKFCLRELIDFPVNLLRTHWRENRMFNMLRSKPVNSSLRVAFGFGLAFFLSALISDIAYQKLTASEDSILGYLMLYYFDLFHTTNGQQIVSWIPGAITS